MASLRWCELCPNRHRSRSRASKAFFAIHDLEVCNSCAAAYFGVFNPSNPALMQLMRHQASGSKARWQCARSWDQKEALTRLQAAYATRVRSMSRAQLKRYPAILNPHGHRIGRSGDRGCYQLDHIVPVILCWEHFVRPEEAAAIENLQVIPWTVNGMRAREFAVDRMVGYPGATIIADSPDKKTIAASAA